MDVTASRDSGKEKGADREVSGREVFPALTCKVPFSFFSERLSSLLPKLPRNFGNFFQTSQLLNFFGTSPLSCFSMFFLEKTKIFTVSLAVPTRCIVPASFGGEVVVF